MEVVENQNEVKLYKYRWIVLAIFCLFTIINFLQFIQFSIIASIITTYYDVDNFAVDLTGLVFFIIYIILFLPVSFLIERYSLKVTAVVSTGLTLAGNLFKLLSANPGRFYAVLLGQSLCAIGQVYMMSIPSKFASVWFGPDEVSTASAFAVLGTQLGVAIGAALPPLMVKTGDKESVGEDLFNMLLYNAIVTAVIFGIVVIFFRGRPKLPPSQSQLNLLTSENNESFVTSFKLLMKNRDFLFVLASFGLCNGIWNSFGIIINQLYLNYFPGKESEVGIITLVAVIAGGCIGSVIFGFILDKTHQFKKTSALVLLASALSLIAVLCAFEAKSSIGSFIAIPIFGFFTCSSLVIGFEFVIEVTYPLPESVSCSALNATIYLLAIIITLTMETLFDVIGYLYTIVIILICLFFCSANIWFVSPQLRRRDANMQATTTNNAN